LLGTVAMAAGLEAALEAGMKQVLVNLQREMASA
jgi:hypothetical protein